MNTLRDSKRHGVPEVNIRLGTNDLTNSKNANLSRKSFVQPQKERLSKVKQRMLKLVIEKRNKGCPISHEVIKLKALEEASYLTISKKDFEANMG
ncbi:hypothetical protein NPIL_402311 [Nephila pilipes]|uniref:Uncharacterized protein n=1 Tax=Nephila pilipes TaxID=299642 RepID=A0A8X6N262_NEPPI|nr:hypothetical protein NPIL_560041 [Nephila pilipes]GFS89529.1 hypothetical protein NPIL_640801 [Nephila pilipes]GFT76328.1 hypothetical protein NPIL_605971 [Nephila pilipes]GFT81303.1 hypothetical protein NPIL_402311 [Nephila pilipes]